MIISHGTERKQITLYPSAQRTSIIDQFSWINETKEKHEEVIEPILSINQFFFFERKIMNIF